MDSLRLAAKQVTRIDCDRRGQALERAQRQVALTAFQAAHVGAMDANEVRESFLTQTALLTVPPEIPADSPLQIALHEDIDAAGSLLVSLHTYKYHSDLPRFPATREDDHERWRRRLHAVWTDGTDSSRAVAPSVLGQESPTDSVTARAESTQRSLGLPKKPVTDSWIRNDAYVGIL